MRNPFKKITEKFKAAFDPVGSSKPVRKPFNIGEYSWKERCEHYDQITNQYSLAKIAPFTLAGLVTAQGVYFKAPKNKRVPQPKPFTGNTPFKTDVKPQVQEAEKKVSYALAEDALEEVQQFASDQQVNSKFYETTWRCSKYGGCFWEISQDPFTFRLPPLQECIEPAEANDQGEIVRWRQVVNNLEVATWSKDELVLVPFLGVTTETWPYAPSIYMGTETELEMLTGVEESAKDYSEKQAWPYELLQVGDAANPVLAEEYNQARTEWKNRKPGQGIVTSVPSEIKAGGTGSSPIRDLAVLCELMKDNVQDSVMIAPISKLYNATEASAKELTKHIMTVLGQPFQWQLASYFKNYVLKPWLEASGYSVKSCPEVIFESPDVHKVEEGDYWTKLVSAKIQTPLQACEHLGLEYDQEFWDSQLQMDQEQFKQTLDAKKDQGFGKKDEGKVPSDAKPEVPKAKEVWKVVRMPNDS